MNTHARVPDTTLPAGIMARIEDALTEAEASRQQQLDNPPPADGDLIASEHRSSVERILTEIRAARQRLANGTFGICERCSTAIPVERLELRPWTIVCVRCAAP